MSGGGLYGMVQAHGTPLTRALRRVEDRVARECGVRSVEEVGDPDVLWGVLAETADAALAEDSHGLEEMHMGLCAPLLYMATSCLQQIVGAHLHLHCAARERRRAPPFRRLLRVREDTPALPVPPGGAEVLARFEHVLADMLRQMGAEREHVAPTLCFTADMRESTPLFANVWLLWAGVRTAQWLAQEPRETWEPADPLPLLVAEDTREDDTTCAKVLGPDAVHDMDPAALERAADSLARLPLADVALQFSELFEAVERHAFVQAMFPELVCVRGGTGSSSGSSSENDAEGASDATLGDVAVLRDAEEEEYRERALAAVPSGGKVDEDVYQWRAEERYTAPRTMVVLATTRCDLLLHDFFTEHVITPLVGDIGLVQADHERRLLDALWTRGVPMALDALGAEPEWRHAFEDALARRMVRADTYYDYVMFLEVRFRRMMNRMVVNERTMCELQFARAERVRALLQKYATPRALWSAEAGHPTTPETAAFLEDVVGDLAVRHLLTEHLGLGLAPPDAADPHAVFDGASPASRRAVLLPWNVLRALYRRDRPTALPQHPTLPCYIVESGVGEYFVTFTGTERNALAGIVAPPAPREGDDRAAVEQMLEQYMEQLSLLQQDEPGARRVEAEDLIDVSEHAALARMDRQPETIPLLTDWQAAADHGQTMLVHNEMLVAPQLMCRPSLPHAFVVWMLLMRGESNRAVQMLIEKWIGT